MIIQNTKKYLYLFPWQIVSVLYKPAKIICYMKKTLVKKNVTHDFYKPYHFALKLYE
jgi:hypothetical protein